MKVNKNLKLTALGLGCLILAGCAKVNADDNYSRYVNEDVVIEDGYYICENDDSYIHIEDGKIELCNFDIEAYAVNLWDEKMASIQDDEEEYAKQAPQRDIVIANTVKSTTEEFALREFTVVSWPFPNETVTMLVWDYEWAQTVNTYTGYNYYDDGSIGKVGNTYYYYGTELPE